MNGADFIGGFKERIGKARGRLPSDRETADRLGISLQALRNWRNKDLNARQMVWQIFRSEKKGYERAQRQAIRPIIEFLSLDPSESSGGVRTEIFDIVDNAGKDRPFFAGLRDELMAHHGIYIFHDSRGRALYVGKAQRTPLWTEIKSAYNRRRTVQKILRVKHPTQRKAFDAAADGRRQIRSEEVVLHDLAAYLSAYQVSDGLVGDLETLLVRSFANDHSNVRMEKFRE